LNLKNVKGSGGFNFNGLEDQLIKPTDATSIPKLNQDLQDLSI